MARGVWKENSIVGGFATQSLRTLNESINKNSEASLLRAERKVVNQKEFEEENLLI